MAAIQAMIAASMAVEPIGRNIPKKKPSLVGTEIAAPVSTGDSEMDAIAA